MNFVSRICSQNRIQTFKEGWRRRNGSEMPDFMIKFSEDAEKSMEILKNYKMLSTSHSYWKSKLKYLKYLRMSYYNSTIRWPLF